MAIYDLHSIIIYGQGGEKVTIHITDDIFEVRAKLERAFKTKVEIQRYSDEHEGIGNNFSLLDLSELPIFNDPNASLTMTFGDSAEIISIDRSEYYAEEDTVILRCIDEQGNSNDIDFNMDSILEMSDDNISFSIPDEETDENIYVRRGKVESVMGEWLFAYPEMAEPFIPLNMTLQKYIGRLPYEICDVDILAYV